MTDEFLEKLDVLIKLQATALVASMDSQKDRIVFLNRAGLKPKLIAEIIGTTANHVSVVLSNARANSKRKDKEL